MNKEIVKILKILESNGYEAYIIGGYVRDMMLGISSSDIDITTNALPKELDELFNSSAHDYSMYGVYKIITNHYNFDITTYRKELTYDGRRPVEIEYTKNLADDVNRRDFTINTICMNSKGEITDLLNGLNDINSKTIRCVGDPYDKLREDPLRILRAYRFAILLNFTIEDNLLLAIKKNLKLIQDLSYNRKKEELDKILLSSNALNGLNILKSNGILKYLEVDFDDIVVVPNICGMYAQLRVSSNYPFTKEEKDTIESIKRILSIGKINNEIMFKYGLYTSQIAGSILGYDEIKVTQMYNNMVIKKESDLDISFEDIITILNIKPSKVIKNIKNDLIELVLNGKLKNEKDDLICYVINNKRKWLNE